MRGHRYSLKLRLSPLLMKTTHENDISPVRLSNIINVFDCIKNEIRINFVKVDKLSVIYKYEFVHEYLYNNNKNHLNSYLFVLKKKIRFELKTLRFVRRLLMSEFSFINIVRLII